MQTFDYRLISALIQKLPKDGRWTQTERDRWVRAFVGAVDYLIEVREVDISVEA